MGDLKSKNVIVLKGILFLAILVGSAALLFVERPTWQTAALVAAVVWASACFYYFLFYVLEKYVDPGLRYSGLLALLTALARRRRGGRAG
jgi:hypothetical protein